MTVIVVDHTGMASDSLISDSNGYSYMEPKIFTGGDWVIGGCGNMINVRIFVDWYKNKRSKHLKDILQEAKQDWDALVYDPTAEYPLTYWGRSLHPEPITQGVYAIGSGAPVAYGAYKALQEYGLKKRNKSILLAATEIAAHCGSGCGGDVQYIEWGV